MMLIPQRYRASYVKTSVYQWRQLRKAWRYFLLTVRVSARGVKQ